MVSRIHVLSSKFSMDDSHQSDRVVKMAGASGAACPPHITTMSVVSLIAVGSQAMCHLSPEASPAFTARQTMSEQRNLLMG